MGKQKKRKNHPIATQGHFSNTTLSKSDYISIGVGLLLEAIAIWSGSFATGFWKALIPFILVVGGIGCIIFGYRAKIKQWHRRTKSLFGVAFLVSIIFLIYYFSVTLENTEKLFDVSVQIRQVKTIGINPAKLPSPPEFAMTRPYYLFAASLVITNLSNRPIRLVPELKIQVKSHDKPYLRFAYSKIEFTDTIWPVLSKTEYAKIIEMKPYLESPIRIDTDDVISGYLAFPVNESFFIMLENRGINIRDDFKTPKRGRDYLRLTDLITNKAIHIPFWAGSYIKKETLERLKKQ